jgi:hypothetical protein
MGRRTAGQFAGRWISEAVHFLLDDLLLRHTESASCSQVVRCEVGQRRHSPTWLLTQLGRDASIIDGGKVSMRGIVDCSSVPFERIRTSRRQGPRLEKAPLSFHHRAPGVINSGLKCTSGRAQSCVRDGRGAGPVSHPASSIFSAVTSSMLTLPTWMLPRLA